MVPSEQSKTKVKNIKVKPQMRGLVSGEIPRPAIPNHCDGYAVGGPYDCARVFAAPSVKGCRSRDIRENRAAESQDKNVFRKGLAVLIE